MHTYSDYFTSIPAVHTFFAGANTFKGFQGEYENLLCEDSFEKIYIIKGGSGTGKSTLMKKCKRNAEKMGLDVVSLLCSSDPKSLDGVIISDDKKQIAIIDGTPPHSADPLYPGACGEIINTGDFWDSSCLEKRKSEIALHTKEKNKAFKTAYNYISAAGNVFRLTCRLAKGYTQKEKMEEAAERICRTFKRGGGAGKVIYRRTHAISMRGAVRLASFENANTVYGIKDRAYIAPFFYSVLLEELTKNGTDVVVSESPIGGIAELYIPSAETSFVPYREAGEYTKEINLGRFTDREGMAAVKQKRIFVSKCMNTLMEGALESLSLAREHHFSLENIYKESMDFSSLDSRSDDLCASILKRFR